MWGHTAYNGGERLEPVGNRVGVGELILVRQGFPGRVELRVRQERLEIVEECFLRFEAVGDDEDRAIGDLREQRNDERLAGIG